MTLKLCLLLTILFLPALIACGPPDLATMVERVKGGVVRIDTAGGNGSGVIFATDGDAALVVTNYHVVAGGGRIAVIVKDADSYQGVLQAFDADRDLATLRICCGDFQALPFGEVSAIRPGSEVIVMGYPSGLPGSVTVTRGIVSAIRQHRVGEVIQTDAPINPGNSGGPLLSREGQVLGINTFGISNAEGLGFALSERMVRAALPEFENDRPAEVTVASTQVSRLTSISSGSHHTCGLRENGKPTCWGVPYSYMKVYPPQERLETISGGGSHTCGLRQDGTPICWGANDYGQAMPPYREKFVSISSGDAHTCGLQQDGTPICWGANDYGQAMPPYREKFEAISSGKHHTCGLQKGGALVCWGRNDYGQAPTVRAWLKAITGGRTHTCGLRWSGATVCWGWHLYSEATAPSQERFKAISSGEYHTCGLRQDGTPVCWGDNGHGQITPPDGENFAAISSGGWHTCGLRSDGTPVCWGWDDYGQATPPGE